MGRWASLHPLQRCVLLCVVTYTHTSYTCIHTHQTHAYAQDDFLLFQRVQRQLSQVIRGVGGLKHSDWRSFCNERKTSEARGWVCMNVCVCMCVCVHLQMNCVYIYIYIHIHACV